VDGLFSRSAAPTHVQAIKKAMAELASNPTRKAPMKVRVSCRQPAVVLADLHARMHARTQQQVRSIRTQSRARIHVHTHAHAHWFAVGHPHTIDAGDLRRPCNPGETCFSLCVNASMRQLRFLALAARVGRSTGSLAESAAPWQRMIGKPYDHLPCTAEHVCAVLQPQQRAQPRRHVGAKHGRGSLCGS